MIVSPYARPDFVLHDVLDHTSVLKLIEEKWNLPPLTRRDAAAVSPLGALDLDAPPAFLTPPDLPPPKRRRLPRSKVGPTARWRGSGARWCYVALFGAAVRRRLNAADTTSRRRRRVARRG